MSVVLVFLIAKFQKKLLENHQILHEVLLVNQKYIEGCKCFVASYFVASMFHNLG